MKILISSWALNGITLDENLAGKNPNPTAKGAYPVASLTWILAYEKGNGRNTKAIKQTFNTLLSDEYQNKASSLGFIPLKGNILLKSRAAVEKIGSWNFLIDVKLSWLSYTFKSS